MERKIIPIVLGGTDYHNSAGAPIQSHINAFEDFKNPKTLAKYLHTLIRNPEKYGEYFWWKQFYVPVTDESIRRYPAFCDLCHQLHETDSKNVYFDLDDWWIQKSKCTRFIQPTNKH